MIINYSDQEVIKGKKSIFLAGPTPREANVISWRTNACQYLEKMDFDGVVYVQNIQLGNLKKFMWIKQCGNGLH